MGFAPSFDRAPCCITGRTHASLAAQGVSNPSEWTTIRLLPVMLSDGTIVHILTAHLLSVVLTIFSPRLFSKTFLFFEHLTSIRKPRNVSIIFPCISRLILPCPGNVHRTFFLNQWYTQHISFFYPLPIRKHKTQLNCNGIRPIIR